MRHGGGARRVGDRQEPPRPPLRGRHRPERSARRHPRGALLRARDRPLQGARRSHRRLRAIPHPRPRRRGGHLSADAPGRARPGVPRPPAHPRDGADARSDEASGPARDAARRLRRDPRHAHAPRGAAAGHRHHRRPAVGGRGQPRGAGRGPPPAGAAAALAPRHDAGGRRASWRRRRCATSTRTGARRWGRLCAATCSSLSRG